MKIRNRETGEVIENVESYHANQQEEIEGKYIPLDEDSVKGFWVEGLGNCGYIIGDVIFTEMDEYDYDKACEKEGLTRFDYAEKHGLSVENPDDWECFELFTYWNGSNWCAVHDDEWEVYPREDIEKEIEKIRKNIEEYEKEYCTGKEKWEISNEVWDSLHVMYSEKEELENYLKENEEYYM